MIYFLGIPIIDGVNLAKTYEEAEKRKKLMEERWSQADGYDIKDDFPCLNLPKVTSREGIQNPNFLYTPIMVSIRS